MSKIIEVVAYDDLWPKKFEQEAIFIKKILDSQCLAIHHIGSTSVPGLCAKPKIDMILVVKELFSIISDLQKTGYTNKGEINIPFHLFCTKHGENVDFNLHVYEEDNPEIELNLIFRDYLRSHADLRDQYAALKLQLVCQKDLHDKKIGRFTGYNLGKDHLIKKILNAAGFSGLCMRFCTHYDEFASYHRIKKEQIFERLSDIVYDENHPSYTQKNHFHFVLYKGTEVIGIAHIEFLDPKTVALRAIAIDGLYKRKGYGKYMLHLVENWVASRGVAAIKCHADADAEYFYRKLGYVDTVFDDPSISKNFVDLGKVL